MSTADNLRKALNILGENGEHWFRGSLSAHDGRKFCAVGALNKVPYANPFGRTGHFTGYITSPETLALQTVILGRTEGYTPEVNYAAHSVAEYNDEGAKDFTDIKSLFEEAIAAVNG